MKGVPFANRYTKRIFLLSKMVYKRVIGVGVEPTHIVFVEYPLA